MNPRKAVSFALLAVSLATTALAQNKPSQPSADPMALLSKGWSHTKISTAGGSPTTVTTNFVSIFHFASADFPGASTSVIFDENTSTVIGDFNFGVASPESAFTLTGGIYQNFTVPGSLPGAEITGINTSGAIVGIYIDTLSVVHGVLDNGGVFKKIDEPAGTTTPFDINNAGEIVGQYLDPSNVGHGFSTKNKGVTFNNFDFPGATATIAAGINTAGVIVGEWTDASSKSHGFTLSGNLFTSIDFPGAAGTTAIGINDSNEIAGYYTDAATNIHGFIYSQGAFATVDVPGASGTELTRVKNNGQLTGAYIDSMGEAHGLIAH